MTTTTSAAISDKKKSCPSPDAMIVTVSGLISRKESSFVSCRFMSLFSDASSGRSELPEPKGAFLAVDYQRLMFDEVKSLEETLLLDLTYGENRDIGTLCSLAQRLGNIHLVYCTSPYTLLRTSDSTKESLSQDMINELQVGTTVGITSGSYLLRAGAIVCPLEHYQTITERDLLSIQSCVLASMSTGAPLFVEMHPYSTNHRAALRIMTDAGMDSSKVVFCRNVLSPTRVDYFCTLLLGTSAHLCLDLFGDDDILSDGPMYPSDEDAAEAVMELCRKGYADRIILSGGVRGKRDLKVSGGPGFAHLSRSVIPLICNKGVSTADAIKMARTNALNLLRWYSPPDKVDRMKQGTCFVCRGTYRLNDGVTRNKRNYCSSTCLSHHRKLGYATYITTSGLVRGQY